jgi:hypothetical protein
VSDAATVDTLIAAGQPLYAADALEETGDALGAALMRVLAEPGNDYWRLQYAAAIEREAGEVACNACHGTGQLDADHRPGTLECRACEPWGSGFRSDGKRERAEFIRCQVELAAERDPDRRSPASASNDRRQDALEKRERELWTTLEKPLTESLPGRSHGVSAVGRIARLNVEVASGATVYHFSRGFVHTVRCDLATWCGGECQNCDGEGVIARIVETPPAELLSQGCRTLRGTFDCPVCLGVKEVEGIGPRLVRIHPIQHLEITDRKPFQAPDGLWRWSESNGHNLRYLDHAMPKAIWKKSWQLWRGHKTPEAAIAVANEQTLLWALTGSPTSTAPTVTPGR